MANSPPLVIPGCIQVKLGYIHPLGGFWNILHFTKAGTVVIDQTHAESIGAAAKTAWTANMAPACPSNVGIVRVSVRDLSAPNLAEFLDTGAGQVGSGVGSDALPPSIALCVTIRTAKAGKSFRGRVYVAGFNEAHSDVNGQADATAGAAALGFLDDFAVAMDSLGFTLGVASRPSNASQLIRRTGMPNGDIVEEVLSSTTQKAGGIEPYTSLQNRDLRWETQRRRMNGRGAPPAAFFGDQTRSRVAA